MPNEARAWLQALFERHGLDRPDGRALYAYRCSEADYVELSRLAGPVLATTIDQGGLLREAPGALFCLFAAEWIRRRYSGGQLRYADIMAAAHVPNLRYAVIQDLVQRGLRFWQRPLLRVGQARIFLLTLACEGGLPMQFLHRDGAALRRYFRALLRDVQTYQGAGLSAETLAAQASSYLPLSLRQDSVYALAGQIVEAVLSLRRQVGDSGDPVESLNRTRPNWRDQLPLELSDHTAQSFLEGLLKDPLPPASGQLGIQLLRSLRRTGGEWQLRADVNLPGLVPAADAITVFGGEPSGRLELLLYRGDSMPTPTVIGWASPCSTGVLVERSRRIARWAGSQAVDAFRLAARPRLPGGDIVPLQGAEALEDLPWIFVDLDGDGERLSFRAQGSIHTRYPVAWVAVPAAHELRPSDGAEVEQLGALAGLDRRLFRVSGEVYVADESGLRCRVVTRSDDPREESHRLYGTRLPVARACLPQYLGAPRLFAIGPDGLPHPVPTGQLRWRSIGPGQTWRRFDAGCIGDGELSCSEQGALRFRTRLGILPTGFSIDYEPRLTPRGGCLRLTGIRGDIGLADVAPDVTWRCVDGQGADDVLIDIRCAGDPPESVMLSLRHAAGGESRLAVPFPAGGARFIDPAGKVLRPGALVPRDRLSGVRARVLSPTGGGHCRVVATLRAPDLTPDLAHSVWLQAPIPRLDGAAGRVRELNMLDVEEDLLAMLSASQSLDATVELRIEGAGLNDREALIRVGRYDLALEPVAGRGAVRLDGESLGRVDADSLARFRVEILPLWAPDDGPRELQQCFSEAVPTGEWLLEREGLAEGPWLVTARDGDWSRTRPLLMTMRGDAESPAKEDVQEDVLAGRDLAAAIRVRDGELRARALRRSVGTLRDDCLLPDWELVRSLIHTFSDLPPSSLDLLPLLAAEPEAVVLALLKEEPANVPSLLALFERLPFSWRLVPIRAWVQATRRHVSALRGQLRELEDCDGMIWGAVAAVLDRAAEQYPYFRVLRELMCWDFHGWLRSGEVQFLRMASTTSGRQALQQLLGEAQQELLRAHADDGNWPHGPGLVPWLDGQLAAHPEAAAVVPETPPGTGFRKPVQSAPIAAAMISVYGIEAPPRVTFEISSLRTFDKHWFDEAYRLALTWMLGYRVEHCPDCWEA